MNGVVRCCSCSSHRLSPSRCVPLASVCSWVRCGYSGAGEATPGRASLLAVVAVGSTGAFLLLTTTYPALLVNTVLQVLVPDAALPEGQVVPLDLPATAGSAAATLLGVVLGLALTWLLFRVAQRDRVVGLALLLLTLTVFVALGVAGAFAALLAAPDTAAPGADRSRVTVPAGFQVQRLVTDLQRPTVVRFGPDGRLYVGVHTVVGSAGAAGDDFARRNPQLCRHGGASGGPARVCLRPRAGDRPGVSRR